MVKLPSSEELDRMAGTGPTWRADGSVSRELSEAAQCVALIIKVNLDWTGSDFGLLKQFQDTYRNELDEHATTGMSRRQVEACQRVLNATRQELFDLVDQKGKFK